MTFLELVQSLARESEIATAPATTVAQTGKSLSFVNKINTAYRLIQLLHKDWNFRRAEFTFDTAASTAEYTASGESITNFGNWDTETFRIYLTATGISDEQFLSYTPWSIFRDELLVGANRTASGRPYRFSVKSDKTLSLWPVPDAIYTVTGEQLRCVDVLSGNDDTPWFHADYHMIIVYRAMMLLGKAEGSVEVFSQGEEEYKRMLGDLEKYELPPRGYGGIKALA